MNGVIPVIGSEKSQIDDAIAQTRGKAMALPVQLNAAGDKLTVSVPDAKDGAAKGEVWLYGVTGTVPVTIGKRREYRPQDHLLQRRAPAGESSAIGPARPKAGQSLPIRSAPTASMAPRSILQSGSAEKPGLMLARPSLRSLRSLDCLHQRSARTKKGRLTPALKNLGD